MWQRSAWFESALAVWVAICGSLVGLARGALLLDFKPMPTSDLPEVAYVGADPLTRSLGAAPGSAGNGDGILPVDQQVPGGLLIETPLMIAEPVKGKIIGPAGTTSFYDVTLVLSGLLQAGPPVTDNRLVYQRLGSGQFRLFATTGPEPPPGELLLEGSISEALILTDSQGQGAVLSVSVQYTAGHIYDALAAKLGLKKLIPISGELSWCLLNMQPTPPAGGQLQELGQFQADMLGQFTYLPEPSALAPLGLLCALVLKRRLR